MNRKINFKFIGLLLMGVAAIAGGTHALHSFQVGRVAKGLLTRADRAEQDGKAGKAEKDLKDYLYFNPDDRQALARFGTLLAKSSRTAMEKSRAAEVLERAVRLDPENVQARRVLAGLLMEEGVHRLEDARGHLEILREDAPNDGEIEAQLARCLEQAELYKDASRHYAAAIKLSPTRLENYVRRAQLLRWHLDDPDEADRVMDAKATKDGIVAKNPGASRAYFERSAYRSAYKIDGTAADAKRALELAPADADALLAMAGVDLGAGDRDAARRHLESGLKLHPGDGRMYEALARVERASNRVKEAEALLRRGAEVVKEQEGRVRLLCSLAEVLIGGGRAPEAREIIARLGDENLRRELADYLEAQILIGEGKWLEASRLLEGAYPHLSERRDLAYQANLLLGRCYEQLGDLDRRHAAYGRAVTADPSALPGQIGLAATLADMGRIEDALALYRRIGETDPASRVAVARLSLARAFRKPEPQRDWNQVDQALDAAAKAAPDAPEVPLLRANSLVARGRRDEARALVLKARDARPDRPEFWVASAELDALFGTPGAALKALAEAKAKLGDRVDFRLAAARYWSARKGAEAAPALAALDEGLESFSPADQVSLLKGLAEAHKQVGDLAGESRTVAELVRLRPKDLGLRIALFDSAMLAGDDAAAGRMVDDMEAIEGTEGTSWRFGKACILIARARRADAAKPLDRAELDRALALLDEVIARRPSWSRPVESRGEVHLLAGRPEAALKDCLQAIDLGERGSLTARRAVQLLYDLRRYEQAGALLRKLKEQGGEIDDPATQKLAAQLSLRAKDPARALDLARRSVTADSKDPRDHAWLGQMLLAGGRADEAEVELRRAIALDPKLAPPYVTLVQCLVRSGRKGQVDAAIAQARAAIPGDLAPLPLAACYQASGRLDEARAQYREALKRQPDDLPALRASSSFDLATGRLDEAKSGFRRIIALESKSAEDAAWARRLLAIVLAGGADPKQKAEALTLLGLPVEGDERLEPSDDEPIEDLRAKARVLASLGDRPRREAALRFLDRVARRAALAPEDRFLVARLNQWAGASAWPRYREQMLALLADDAPNPAYLDNYIRALLRRGDATEARLWVEKLERAEKGSARALELRARLLQAEGKTEAAAEMLVGLASGGDDRILPAAAILEELGHPSRAEPLYDRYAERSKRPQAALFKAAFLGRQGRLAAALDLCEAALRTCPPQQVALTVVAALYAAPVDAPLADRAARIVEAASGGKPPTAEILYHLANVRGRQGRYPEAEALYRRSLELDPTNTGPMNNLAWLLARTGRDPAEAGRLIDRAVSLTGPGPDVLDTRGVVRLAQDRAEEAVRDLEDAVATSDAPPAATLLHLAEARLLNQDRKGAESALRGLTSAGSGSEAFHPLDATALGRLRGELARD